jgi:phage I-like protein
LGNAVSGADSVYVLLHDYNGKTLLKRASGNAASVTFSASEISTLNSGNGMLQVAPWNYKSEDFSDKKYYFVNETCYTKMGIPIN